MSNSNTVSTPVAQHFKLSLSQPPSTDAERQIMGKIPYASCVGGLMYLMVCTRPYLAHAMSVVSKLIANPRTQHWAALKRILRYLKGTLETILGGCVSWKSNMQKVVALSSTEAEYMDATEAITEAIWLKGFTTKLSIKGKGASLHELSSKLRVLERKKIESCPSFVKFECTLSWCKTPYL
ncbi:secreted RxLR effector protein 161-like [Humulus lupulus]|uniref:secreted RxLR effector protein 161-like n=1 Tax=Humulus lupulus TaxID=3486 RepID=UPI002B416ADD|nr:secreted RxLR effector protein 161-like [Humulus lupulus]